MLRLLVVAIVCVGCSAVLDLDAPSDRVSHLPDAGPPDAAAPDGRALDGALVDAAPDGGSRDAADVPPDSAPDLGDPDAVAPETTPDVGPDRGVDAADAAPEPVTLGVVPGDETTEAPLVGGGLVNGERVDGRCEGGRVLVGFDVRYDEGAQTFVAARVLCSGFRVFDNDGEIRLVRGTVVVGEWRGDAEAGAQVRLACPPGAAATGVVGANSAFAGLRNVAARCRRLQLERAFGVLSVAFEEVEQSNEVGRDGGDPRVGDCADDSAAVGLLVRVARQPLDGEDVVVQLGAECARLSIAEVE